MSVSNLSEILPGWRNLGCSSPAPINLSISCQFLMTCEVYVEHSLMGLLLHFICSFSLYDFNFFFPLCLNFFSLILDMFLFEFIIFGTLDWLDLGIYFFSHVQEAFDYNLKYFLIPFIFFFSSLTHHLNVGVLNAVSDVSETFLIPFQSFFPLFFLDQLFPSLYPPAHLSVLLQLFYHFFPLRLLLFVCLFF